MWYNAPMIFTDKTKIPYFPPQKACCFTGNRPIKLPWGNREEDIRCASLKERLYREVETLIKEGYTLFISGMAQGSDIYFAEIVLELRSKYPLVKLECAIPCPEQANGWGKEQKIRYNNILEEADYHTIVSQEYSKGCMFKRNRYMVDKSSCIISVCYTETGGTASTVSYARKKGLKVINLA